MNKLMIINGTGLSPTQTQLFIAMLMDALTLQTNDRLCAAHVRMRDD